MLKYSLMFNSPPGFASVSLRHGESSGWLSHYVTYSITDSADTSADISADSAAHACPNHASIHRLGFQGRIPAVCRPKWLLSIWHSSESFMVFSPLVHAAFTSLTSLFAIQIGDWDVSRVEDFSCLCYDDLWNQIGGADSFNEPINWNTGT